MRPPNPQSVEAITRCLPTTSVKRRMRSATRSGCSTTLVAWLTTPGRISLSSGSLTSSPDGPFVLVAHVAGLERIGLAVDREHHVDDVVHRQVGRVRAVPAAPAQVEADAILRQAANGVIERLDAHHGEFPVGLDRRAPDRSSPSSRRSTGSSSCRIRPASTIALYSSRIASAQANRNSSSVL